MVVLVLGDAEVASWPLPGCGALDLGVVDDLARLQLAARRLGCSIRVRHAGSALAGLIDLAGLGEVLDLRQVGGQAEGGEEGGVEEVVMPHDPIS